MTVVFERAKTVHALDFAATVIGKRLHMLAALRRKQNSGHSLNTKMDRTSGFVWTLCIKENLLKPRIEPRAFSCPAHSLITTLSEIVQLPLLSKLCDQSSQTNYAVSVGLYEEMPKTKVEIL
jgi:hypothetical protein